MCSTTPKTKAASPGVKAPSQIGDKTKSQHTLQQYLDQIYPAIRGELGPDLGQKTHVAISIYLQSKGLNHKYAGTFDDEHQFSGSLLKVAAMSAAFKLRQEATDLADQVNHKTVTAVNATQFFNKLAAGFNLSNAVDGITGNSSVNKKPAYTDILSVTGFPSSVNVDFTPSFLNHMRQMIIVSNNCSAGECIVRLGYPYINVKLMEDAFFDGTTWNTSTPKGIWLAGTYIEPTCFNVSKNLPYVRITTTNDCGQTNTCGSAQNTSSREMARFFLKILVGQSKGESASQGMFNLLSEAQAGVDTSFVSRVTSIPLLFSVEGVKIGIGPLKPDPERTPTILSEGIIINWDIADASEQKKWDDMNLTGKAAICWQNLNNKKSLIPGIAKVINQTISKFINQEPI